MYKRVHPVSGDRRGDAKESRLLFDNRSKVNDPLPSSGSLPTLTFGSHEMRNNWCFALLKAYNGFLQHAVRVSDPLVLAEVF
jgi:hypothetical protein